MENITREMTYEEELEIFNKGFLPEKEMYKKISSEPSEMHCLKLQTSRITNKMLAEIGNLKYELQLRENALKRTNKLLKDISKQMDELGW